TDQLERERQADDRDKERRGDEEPVGPVLFHPTTPAAARTASVRRSGALEVIAAIWTGFSIPISIGPIVALPASSRRSLAERLADCRPGMTRTLAGPDSRLNG